MKVLIVLAALAAVACAGVVPSDAELEMQWVGFKAIHSKTYADEAEEVFRMKVFKENAIRVAKHNERYQQGEVTFKVAINKHSDLHTHEVTEILNGFRMEQAQRSGVVHQTSDSSRNTKKVDWRTKGYVTDVKDQGPECGSCWSFSATGALEGQLFKKTGKLVAISEQNLVDCSNDERRYGNAGCHGGVMDGAFQYIKDNGGIDSESSYPYKGVEGRCKYSSSKSVGTDTGFVDVNPTEKDLKDALTRVGPISIAIDASQWSFQNYAGGVYYEPYCSSTHLDHGVLAVGYGTDFSKGDYWIVKNSWGPSWGEGGYIKIARNKNNHCGVATMASYPTV